MDFFQHATKPSYEHTNDRKNLLRATAAVVAHTTTVGLRDSNGSLWRNAVISPCRGIGNDHYQAYFCSWCLGPILRLYTREFGYFWFWRIFYSLYFVSEHITINAQ